MSGIPRTAVRGLFRSDLLRSEVWRVFQSHQRQLVDRSYTAYNDDCVQVPNPEIQISPVSNRRIAVLLYAAPRSLIIRFPGNQETKNEKRGTRNAKRISQEVS